MTTTHHYDTFAVTLAGATHIGGRANNADAACFMAIPPGVGAAVVDGVGDSQDVVEAACRAADSAASVASHRGAQAGIMAGAETMPDYPGCPDAVGAVVSIQPDGRIEVAHIGDAAVWAWSTSAGLTRYTVDQTVGEHIRYMLTNPDLTDTARKILKQHGHEVVAVMEDYVLNGFAFATTSTISWTPLRGERAKVEKLLLTSDGVHKSLSADDIARLVTEHTDDAQALANALVDAAVTAPRDDPKETADNATAVVITLARNP